MKKIISQISLILLIITIGITSVFINQVTATASTVKFDLSVTSATEGGTFTITLLVTGDDVAGANCDVEVIFSDGTKLNTGTSGETGIAYVKGMENMGFGNTITFSAKVAGNATVRATNINIVDGVGEFLKEGETIEKTITIQSKNPPPQTPTPTPDPKPDPKPEPTPDPGQSGTSSENSGTTNTTTNSTTNKTTTNTIKEPEIKNPTFKEVNETVYAINGCNVRSSCSTEISSNKIGGLVKGQAVKRTGVEDTWSRIEFNGKIAYVATRLLSTEEPIEEPENTITENTVNNVVSNNTISNNIVKNNIIENTVIENNEISEEEILNQIEKEIGVLPEVGDNIATKIFVMISILSLVMIMRLEYKSRE